MKSALLAILLPILLVQGCAKKPPATLLSTHDDLDEAHLNAVVRELVPLVEEAAGVAFDEVPFVRLGRKTDLDRIVRAEAGATYDVLSPGAPEWLRDRFIRGMESDGVAGKYALNERILLVSPDSMSRMAQRMEDNPDALDHVTRLVLAHELAHALQDQHADIGARFTGASDVDAFQALRGVTEGHANFVEARVAEILGLQDVVKALRIGQGWDDDGPNGVWSYGTWVAYGQGHTFIQWHADAGGLPHTWAVLRDPPQRTRTLFAPDEYGQERVPDAADRERLDGFEQILMDARWFPQSGPLVEQDLRQRLFGVPAPEVESALDAVTGGASRSASRNDRAVTAFVLHLVDAEAASTLIQLPMRFPEGLAKTRSPSPMVTALVTPTAVDVGDEAVQVRAGVSRDGETSAGPGSEVHSLWVRSGSDVVIVEATGFRPGDRLVAAAQAIVDRL